MQVRAQRHQIQDANSGQIQERFQATIAHNDLSLPDAEELEKYQRLDPALVPWLIERSGREQDFRHESHRRKLTVREKNARSDRRLNGWGMVSAFIIFMAGMGIGGFLIYKDHSITGSIFSGVTLVAGAGLFLARNTEKTKPTQLETITETSAS
jgi:uncharacterized membrane protein